MTGLQYKLTNIFLFLFFSPILLNSISATAVSTTYDNAFKKAKAKIITKLKQKTISIIKDDFDCRISRRKYNMPYIKDSLFIKNKVLHKKNVTVSLTLKEKKFWENQNKKFNLILKEEIYPNIANKNATQLIKLWDKLFLPLPKNSQRKIIVEKIVKIIHLKISESFLDAQYSVNLKKNNITKFNVYVNSPKEENFIFNIFPQDKTIFSPFIIKGNTNELINIVLSKKNKHFIIYSKIVIPNSIKFKNSLYNKIKNIDMSSQTIPIYNLNPPTISIKGFKSKKISDTLKKYGYNAINSDNSDYTFVINYQIVKKNKSKIKGFYVKSEYSLKIIKEDNIIIKKDFSNKNFSLTSLSDAKNKDSIKSEKIITNYIINYLRGSK